MSTNTTNHPIAVMHMANGSEIVIELLPEAAPNTVNSFIYAVQNKVYDKHAIERIVPGSWIDLSYTAFGKEAARYLIPWEFELNPQLVPLPSHPGCVCMGGYDELGEAGCEVFFPLRNCPEHLGKYPVFGTVLKGMEELYRLEKVPTIPITDYPMEGVEINKPATPERIDYANLELNGYIPKPPVKVAHDTLPACWLT